MGESVPVGHHRGGDVGSASPEQGGQILDWAGDRYEVTATFGGDPLDFRQRGLMILRRRR